MQAALQFYIYDRMLESAVLDDGSSVSLSEVNNSMYSVPSMYSDPLKIYPLSEALNEEMSKELDALLAEIADVSKPFSRTEDREVCKWCDFKMICGR